MQPRAPRAERTVCGSARLARWGLVLLLAIASVIPERIGSQELSLVAPIDAQLAAKLQKRGDLTLRDTNLADALATLSESWDINIVASAEAQTPVSGVFRDAPLAEILDSILQAGGYTYRPMGASLVIQRAADDQQLNPWFQSATIPLGVAKPEEVIEGVKLLASPQGKVQAVPSANSLVVFDTPQRIAVIRQFISSIDESARQSVADAASGAASMQAVDFAPQYVDVKSLKEVVQSLLSKDGKTGTMDLENRLVVFDYPANLKLIRETIERVDIPRPQVRITALIYDLSIEDVERLGVNWQQAGVWDRNADGEATGMLGIDSIMQLPASAADPSSTLTLMNLSKHFDLTGVVEALRQLKNARLLADPTVTVVDREEATMQIVTEIPYQQLTQTAQGGDIGTTAFREAGVTLNVRPRISCDGTLLLEVTPTFSRLTGFTQGAQPQPIIDKREAKTTVRVANGQTLVIGGLRQRGDTRERRGVPLLKDLECFGCLFRSRNDTIRESELVVFITPEIVMPCVDHTRPREHAAGAKIHQMLNRIPVAPHLEGPCIVEDMPHGEGTIVIPEAIPQGEPLPADAAPAQPPSAPQPAPAGEEELRAPRSGARHWSHPQERVAIRRLPAVDEPVVATPQRIPAPPPPVAKQTPTANQTPVAARPRTSPPASSQARRPEPRQASQGPVRSWIGGLFR